MDLIVEKTRTRPDRKRRTFTLATCLDRTGIDPFSDKELSIAGTVRERRMQRALMQFFKPEHYFEVREALEAAGPT